MSDTVQDIVRIRRWPFFAIIAVAVLAVWKLHFAGLTIFKPILDLYLVFAFANLLFYVWLRVWSNFAMRMQLAIGAAILIAQLACISSFRIDGFDGTGRVIAKWRWSKTPEQVLAEGKIARVVSKTVEMGPIEQFDSPGFRGHRRDGKFSLGTPGFQWNNCHLTEMWRRPIGRGWSSFAIVGKYCFTQEQVEMAETVTCLELNTGHIAWQYELNTRFDEYTSGPGPRATPAIIGNNIVALGATGNLVCLNASDGSEKWLRKLCRSKQDEILFGFSSSPLIIGEKIFVTLGYPNDSIVCVDLDSGKVLWSRDKRRAGYSSPHLFEHPFGRSVLLFDAVGLHSYELESGGLEWSFPWGDNSDDQVNVCQPAIVDDETILISSGYGRGCCLLKVTRNDHGQWSVKPVWKTNRLKSKFASLVVQKGHVFGLDSGILTCLDLKNGERSWKQGRYRHGQLIQCDDVLVVQAEPGFIAIVDADPKGFREIRRFDALKDRTWVHPVISKNCLLVRNDREAVCFSINDRRSMTKPD